MTTEADIKAATDPKLLDELVLANRILFSLGVLDAYGHVSVRDPKRPDHFFLARGIAPALVTLDDIMVFNGDSEPVEARGRAMYSERYIHGEVYRVRGDVHSVVHSHSPTVIPFTISKTALRPVYHMASFIPQATPVYEIRDTEPVGDLLIKTSALGRALARTLGQNTVALMRGHGNVVVGPDLRYAVFRAYYTEVNARLQLQARTLEGPLTFISAEETANTFGGTGITPGRAWEMWVRAVKEADAHTSGRR